MRVYLSTSSSDLGKVQDYMQRVRNVGHEIVYDWMEGINAEKDMTGTTLAGRAIVDVAAVTVADVLVVVMQEKMKTAMTGAAVEIGAALASGVPVWIAEEECKFDHFFKYHPLVYRCVSLNIVLRLLEQEQSS